MYNKTKLCMYFKNENLVCYSFFLPCLYVIWDYLHVFGYTLQLMDTLKTGAHGARVVRHVIMESRQGHVFVFFQIMVVSPAAAVETRSRFA